VQNYKFVIAGVLSALEYAYLPVSAKNRQPFRLSVFMLLFLPDKMQLTGLIAEQIIHRNRAGSIQRIVYFPVISIEGKAKSLFSVLIIPILQPDITKFFFAVRIGQRKSAVINASAVIDLKGFTAAVCILPYSVQSCMEVDAE